MDNIRIRGGVPLEGTVRISGAKNAALPILCASLLADGESTFRNVPALRDISTISSLLRTMGLDVELAPPVVKVTGRPVDEPFAPYDLVRKMRASVLVLGPLVARYGRAKVSLPGGCAIGARPIDQHLKGLQAMGAEVELEHGYVNVEVPAGRLRGAEIWLDMPTVTGTENLMSAAVLAKGRTTLLNAAREPEVEELARVLNKMGARVEGAGTNTIVIHGVDELQPIDHAVIPDRIEAGTYMVAAAATGGNVLLDGIGFDHLQALASKLREAGVIVEREENGIRVAGKPPFRPVDVTTAPHPDFPTDMQAQFMMLMCLADGVSVITETIFENRFMHVSELNRMGAQIDVQGRRATVKGPMTLTGAKVMATDLRASASLVIAGLVARDVTEVLRVYHIDRGYERIEEKLAGVGARIERVPGVSEAPLTIAVPKGRILKTLCPLLAAAGLDPAVLLEPDRRLVREDRPNGLRYLLLKPDDVPTYVEYGAADLGVVGRDVLVERRSELFAPLDLGIGRCRMAVAGLPGTSLSSRAPLRVGTKYPRITRDHFARRGRSAEIIPLSGSVELAPLTGLADLIVDIVESGETLRRNGLAELEPILEISAVVVANRVGLKLRRERIRPLLDALEMARSRSHPPR